MTSLTVGRTGTFSNNNMITADIRQSFSEPYASMYCQLFDNLKNVGDFFEYAVKLMRQ